MNQLDAFLTSLHRGLFTHRFRDVAAQIRAECMTVRDCSTFGHTQFSSVHKQVTIVSQAHLLVVGGSAGGLSPENQDWTHRKQWVQFAFSLISVSHGPTVHCPTVLRSDGATVPKSHGPTAAPRVPQAMGSWLLAYPSFFLKDFYLKYMGWRVPALPPPPLKIHKKAGTSTSSTWDGARPLCPPPS